MLEADSAAKVDTVLCYAFKNVLDGMAEQTFLEKVAKKHAIRDEVDGWLKAR